jgi:hypothetical protein
MVRPSSSIVRPEASNRGVRGLLPAFRGVSSSLERANGGIPSGARGANETHLDRKVRTDARVVVQAAGNATLREPDLNPFRKKKLISAARCCLLHGQPPPLDLLGAAS